MIDSRRPFRAKSPGNRDRDGDIWAGDGWARESVWDSNMSDFQVEALDAAKSSFEEIWGSRSIEWRRRGSW